MTQPEKHSPEGEKNVKEEIEKIVEKKDAQEAANFEEVPAWAAGLMQTVKDVASRLDAIEVKSKGGVPEVEDGQEGTTAVAKDAVGEPAESADNGPVAGRKFAAEERAETRGKEQFAGENQSPVTASKAEQERLQRSPAGPTKAERDPKLEDGVIRLNTEGQRADLRGHEPDKAAHHANDRMDAINRKLTGEVAEMRALLNKAMRQPSIEDRNAIATARKRADSVYAALGRTTPEILPGESPMAFRHRLADGLKDLSVTLKKTVMDALPDDVFGTIETHVYADAMEAAKRPTQNAPLVLRPHTYQDSTGHQVTEYFGDNLAWMSPFMTGGQRVKVNRNAGNPSH